jgi:hypothetical protein
MSGQVLRWRTMEGAMSEETTPERAAARISGEFRNGSLTAISVIVGFSLSFLSRWAGTPGKWHTGDLSTVALLGEIAGVGQGILGG